MTSLRGALTAMGCLLSLALAGAPAEAAQFSADQTTEIQQIMKSYLLQHPEVLRDAITELDNREKLAETEARKKTLADVAGPLYSAPDGFVVGNPTGKVTVVEFFDYNCGYCKRVSGDLDNLLKSNPDLKVILRDFPILSPNSVNAAIIAAAVHEQLEGAKFYDYHRKLLNLKGVVGKDQALAIAKDMGVDMARLAKDAADPKIRAAIQESDNIAKSLALNGTPSYVIGDDVTVGAMTYDDFNQKIRNVRKCGKAMCS